ncbi:MAG TPA: NapC/NirT family cytochrome c [Thermodesulfovibrionales bacterium]|nr:NapC/NirT family cytochrome c [Thermodesulfovibrionales bacterium]
MFRKIKDFILKPFRWLEMGVPLKAKILIAVLLLILLVGAGYGSFRFYDFTQNNPKFCVSCHLMKTSFEAWEKSEHRNINCHECHHLSIEEMNKLLINFVLKRPTAVPERHGKIIVPWKFCIRCHWEKDPRYPNAVMINKSTLHAKHVFIEQEECSKCHGYIVHKFTPEAHFCIRCHQGKVVHGEGMGELACLNCHTDRTTDLKPGRKKCLFCHGTENVRKELIADASMDVKHFQPSQATIAKAIKINVPSDAPMQFACYTCHHPHAKARPEWGDCLSCHRNIPSVGKHSIHLKVVGMQCKECHKPHSWRVTSESAKKECIKCHEYKEPKQFIGS